MRETSEKFNLPTLPGLPKCIRSQALVGGPSHSDRQDGPMTGQCGQARALVKASQEPASALGSKTKDTCGLNSTGSLASAALTRSLASRLHPVTGSTGWILYATTWKLLATPSGRLLPVQQAQARRTSVKGCTGLQTLHPDGLDKIFTLRGWPTPTARVGKDVPYMQALRQDGKPRLDQVSTVVLAHFGMLRVGSQLLDTIPGMEGLSHALSRTRLNPDFCRWLMGYPATWSNCAAMATLSASPRRKRS